MCILSTSHPRFIERASSNGALFPINLASSASATSPSYVSHKTENRVEGQKKPLPPGPTKLPIILGAPTVVVSSAEAAREFLKTHDIDCCSRPPLVGLGKFSYNHRDISFAPYGDYWREDCIRKEFQASELVTEDSRSVIEDHLNPGRVKEEREDIIDVLLRIEREQSESSALQFTKITRKQSLRIYSWLEWTLVAITVSWAMTELARNPRIMKKAQAEVRNSIGNKGKVTEGDVDQLHYLKMVVKETLRLHPPAPLLLPRETMSHFENKRVPHLPENPSPRKRWAIGRDPNLWKNPEEFLPERFMDNSVDFRGQHLSYCLSEREEEFARRQILAWKKQQALLSIEKDLVERKGDVTWCNAAIGEGKKIGLKPTGQLRMAEGFLTRLP
ncbi:Cytochrome P450 71B36 [Vitis vinifera]|uniref:Cytochrome P450 71B36 n=1 Tax=Vitis vinifera TaxID=29760 RepID=A0A438J5Y0_VITVI|nr:Cytochrome P450 71B36 [Vitis vinifera]